MKKTMLALVCLSGLVGGCGQAEQAANESFDREFLASCVAAANTGTLPQELATQACDCALEKINERYDTAEKLALSNEQAQPIALECFNQVTQGLNNG